MKDTPEQLAAIEAEGNVIVSASAGSGKTYVMIKKLTAAVLGGADLDEVLCVTFTKKAAAQMKEKLSKSLVEAIISADARGKQRIKLQLSKIQSADISTIHAFCARLIRTYFYALGVDSSFDIISADDACAQEYKTRAADAVFERGYDSGDKGFYALIKAFRKKRSDAYLKRVLCECYDNLRINADYAGLLQKAENLYTEEGFEEVCASLAEAQGRKYAALRAAVEDFARAFDGGNAEVYGKIFGEMISALTYAEKSGLFDVLPPVAYTKKPRDGESDKQAGEKFRTFRAEIQKRYTAVRAGLLPRDEEREIFLKSGVTVRAFCALLRQFDGEYTAIKRDENKLDYNDLEHLCLALLKDGQIRDEIRSRYKYVFVDEYQDINPVQESIITGVSGGAQTFFVGDVKQAIYGFRGSRSLFFANKFEKFCGGEGKALRLSSNFRSSGGVIDFVNALFSQVMREDTCGFDYKDKSLMVKGAAYPEGYGFGKIHIFGAEPKEDPPAGVYSVEKAARGKPYSREGLCVLKIVKEELASKRYDLEKGCMVDVAEGDICILTRKNKGDGVREIVRALTDAGYAVAGAQSENLCERPECKNMLDILSYLDNSRQDIPLATTLLSPVGGFCEDELARIRISVREINGDKRPSFYECCKAYSAGADGLAAKLRAFYARATELRDLAEVLSAGELIDRICLETGYEAEYSAGGGEKLRNIRRLSAEGENLTLQEFLSRLSAGGYNIPAPPSAAAESIKIMTMHAAKGLEFPVVIIADICRTFKGMDFSEMPLDTQYGFAPKLRDPSTMLQYNTVLRRLAGIREDYEELKNEFNLFYVACTRAMSRLHVLAEEIKPYSPYACADARCYAQTFDASLFDCVYEEPEQVNPAARAELSLSGGADGELFKEIDGEFKKPYPNLAGVNLPVKSSASAIMKLAKDEEYYRPNCLFGGEGETGTVRGTAYHRFMELCDFSLTSAEEIRGELSRFVSDGSMTAAQRELLSEEELSEILKMPVFAGLAGARLYREQEFLCRLPANQCLATDCADPVLLQGAIDLLAETDGGVRIIDYKYSGKSDGQLKESYSAQLALYRKVAAKIMGVKENGISCVIVNIHLRRQIPLDLP